MNTDRREFQFFRAGHRHVRLLFVLALSPLAPGCIIVPMPGAFFPPPNDFKAVVGAKESAAPLKVGVSSRRQVREALGEPYRPHDDDMAWQYSHDYLTGYFFTIPGACNSLVNPIYGHYKLEIKFGPEGKIGNFWTGRD